MSYIGLRNLPLLVFRFQLAYCCLNVWMHTAIFFDLLFSFVLVGYQTPENFDRLLMREFWRIDDFSRFHSLVLDMR